jgi:hypothetical protein
VAAKNLRLTGGARGCNHPGASTTLPEVLFAVELKLKSANSLPQFDNQSD